MDTRYEQYKEAYQHIIDNCERIVKTNISAIKKTRKKFLDIGCGSGGFIIHANKCGYNAYGLEPIKKYAQIARKNIGGGAMLAIGEGESLPFKTKFDIIALNEVIEHVKDWKKVINESIASLEKGGVLFISTSNKQHPFTNEVNNFPFFPYLPEYFQHKFIGFCVKHRPDIINFTTLPVNNYFTHYELRKHLKSIHYNLIAYDEIELYNKENLKSYKKILKPLWKMTTLPFIRFLLYFFVKSTRLYVIKMD